MFLIKYKNRITFIFLVISLIFIKESNFIFYDINQSPDFAEYFTYFTHFSNTEIFTLREHGLLYYYIHYISFFFQYGEVPNNSFLIHKVIQQNNFYIYIFGLMGYYKLLKYLKFRQNSIYLTFIFVNIFPISIIQRIVLKPELLAFALLPWILFCIEKYRAERNIVYLYLSLPILISCLTLKGNVLVIVSIYILLTNIQTLVSIPRKHLVVLLVFFGVVFSLITIENNLANNKTLLEVQSGATLDEKYNNKAPFNIIYKTNLYKLITSPVKHDHANSFIGITLLETSGDYFDLYWDNDCCNYFKNRRDFLLFEIDEKIVPPKIDFTNKTITIFIQGETDIYLYERIGVFVSLAFFYFLIRETFRDKKGRKFYVGIYIGMALLLLHTIFGVPVNNFDPNIGDTFKPHYYSFVFLLSTIFLTIRLIQENKGGKYFLILFSLFTIINIGLLKNITPDFSNKVEPYLEYSSLCNLNQIVYESIFDIESLECVSENKKYIENIKNYKNFSFKPFNLIILISTIMSIFKLSNFRIYKPRS
jgi:hypothetical protein